MLPQVTHRAFKHACWRLVLKPGIDAAPPSHMGRSQGEESAPHPRSLRKVAPMASNCACSASISMQKRPSLPPGACTAAAPMWVQGGGGGGGHSASATCLWREGRRNSAHPGSRHPHSANPGSSFLPGPQRRRGLGTLPRLLWRACGGTRRFGRRPRCWWARRQAARQPERHAGAAGATLGLPPARQGWPGMGTCSAPLEPPCRPCRRRRRRRPCAGPLAMCGVSRSRALPPLLCAAALGTMPPKTPSTSPPGGGTKEAAAGPSVPRDGGGHVAALLRRYSGLRHRAGQE